MNDSNLLIGSLSNDLFRVATLAQRGSSNGAMRFLLESKKWTALIKEIQTPDYIKEIVNEVHDMKIETITDSTSEKLLMFGVLLQNYSLHM